MTFIPFDKFMLEHPPGPPVAVLFDPGDVGITPAAASLAGVDWRGLLDRHLKGDWGDLNEDDRNENDLSSAMGFRVVSCYDTVAGRVAVVTDKENDKGRRERTTFCLAAEV